jgi:uroporphyrin-III C-methyltransferase/precorrin-2 dehydrogenase/sirohydrochlorin ferrochelatase
MEQMLEPRLGDLAAIAGRLRDRAAARLQPRERRDLWRWVFAGPVRQTHSEGREREAAKLIKTAIDTASFGVDQEGSVALVGAGPGAKDLITLRGVQRLQEADVIYYDRLIDPEVLDLARRDAERVYVGKAPGCHHWPQDKITGVLVAAAKQGKRVVRLKCGDPGIFARGAEEASALKTAGIPFEIIPGVTAASAASAALGDFLTERGAFDTLSFVTGQSHATDTPPTNWSALLQPGARVAVYMGVSAAAQIEASLKETGIADELEISMVSNAQQASQKVSHCAVDNLVDTIVRDDIQNPAILFVSRPLKAQQQTETGFQDAVQSA